VFGSNPLLWPFPLFGESGKPLGDGVIFHQRGEVISQRYNFSSLAQLITKMRL